MLEETVLLNMEKKEEKSRGGETLAATRSSQKTKWFLNNL